MTSTVFKPEIRALMRDAEQLGYEFSGYDGHGHPRVRHTVTGAGYSLPATPSDHRSLRNTRADLERLAGRKLPRQRSGRARGVRVTNPLRLQRTPAEQRTGAEIDNLMGRAEALRGQFDELVGDGSRSAAAAARRILARYEEVRDRLIQLHHDIPQIV